MTQQLTCPRCGKSHSQDLNFYFKKDRVRLNAQSCKVCGFIWAEDKELLKAARKHLYALTKKNEQRDSGN